MLQLQIPQITGEIKVSLGNLNGRLGSTDMMCTMWIANQETSVMPVQVSECSDGFFKFPEHVVNIDREHEIGPKVLIIKISGSGGLPEGNCIQQYTKPQITQSNIAFALDEICQHNKTLIKSSKSEENSGITYTITVKTRFALLAKKTKEIDLHPNIQDNRSGNVSSNQYVSDAQQAILAQLRQKHLSIEEISTTLEKMSANRKLLIMNQINSWTTEENLKNFQDSWIEVPTFNHLFVTKLDSCQLNYATKQVAIANQDKHVINLIVASQQTLVDIHRELYGSATITPASAANAADHYRHSVESHDNLRKIFVNNLTKYVNIKTSYTYDTRVQGLYVTVPSTNTNIQVPDTLDDQKSTVLFSPIVDPSLNNGGGEDYSLAGLTTTASYYMRCACLPNIAASIQHTDDIDNETKNALLASVRANQNCLIRKDDCEGSASAIVGACTALRDGEISKLEKSVQLILTSRIARHDVDYHAAIKSVLFTTRAALQNTNHEISVSLVMARAAQANTLSTCTQSNDTDDKVPTLASTVQDLTANMANLGGHAVATTLEIAPLQNLNGIDSRLRVISIAQTTTHEGTVETIEATKKDPVLLNLSSTDPTIDSHLQKINNSIVPEYDADSIIAQVLADAAQHLTGISHSPTHKSYSKANDSFYAYTMSCAEYFTFMLNIPRDDFIAYCQKTTKNYRNEKKIDMSPFSSMVLASRYQDIDAQSSNRPPVSIPYGISVPPCKNEIELLSMMARLMAPSYPDITTQICSAECTLFALPYTNAILQDNTIDYKNLIKINCTQPVSVDFNNEIVARNDHQKRSNAVALRHIDSHCFSMYIK